MTTQKIEIQDLISRFKRNAKLRKWEIIKVLDKVYFLKHSIKGTFVYNSETKELLRFNKEIVRFI
jgi:hypothetical protein